MLKIINKDKDKRLIEEQTEINKARRNNENKQVQGI